MRGLYAIAAMGIGLGPGCSLLLDWELPPDAGLPLEACMQHEPNNTFAEAITIPINDPGPFAVCLAGDVDFYRFNVPAPGMIVTIAVHHELDPERISVQDLDVFLYDDAGALVSNSNTFTSSETITCPGMNPTCAPGTGLVAGNYVIEVIGATQYVYNTYQLQINFTAP